MQLGRHLAPPVLCPVHTVGHQLKCGRIDGMDPDFETVRQALPLAPGPEVGFVVLEMREGFSEDLLNEGCGTSLVGVGEVIAGGRRQAQPGDGAGLHPEPVTDVIETERVDQLDKNHPRQMDPDAEGPGLGPGPVAGWLGGRGRGRNGFHNTSTSAGFPPPARPSFNLDISNSHSSCGMAVKHFLRSAKRWRFVGAPKCPPFAVSTRPT